MLTIAYYFLQVVLCSGMMMGYYWLVLRNKRFHQYNRFYLLAIALLSWIVPLIKISWSHPVVNGGQPQVMQFLSVVADNNTQIEQTISKKGFEWSWNMLATGIYFCVAAILLLGLLRAFARLYFLLKNHPCKNVGAIYLILTQAKGTPFSFFRYIFWNEEIDIRSDAGKQILQHELTHVQQKHSFDKLLIQVILIGGWFNPFFWLLKKEMEMIHEFIADKKAVNNGDTASLAQMLLTAAYPQQQFALTHSFFFSPIKRRLQMLANTKNPRFSYIRRLVVLPLLGIVVMLFAFRSKEQRASGTLSVASVVENVVEKGKDLLIVQNGVSTIPSLADTITIQADTVVITGKEKADVVKIVPIKNPALDKPLMILDGKKEDSNILKTLDPNLIQSVDVLKNESAIALYGEEGKNGVIIVTTRKTKTPAVSIISDSVDNTYNIKPENTYKESIKRDTVKGYLYPHAMKSWVRGTLMASSRDIASSGLTMVGYQRGNYPGSAAFKKSNRDVQEIFWIESPSRMVIKLKDGSEEIYDLTKSASRKRAEGKYGKLPVTSGKAERSDITVTDLDVQKVVIPLKDQAITPAVFPGGRLAWDNYVKRNLNKDILIKKNAPPGLYTVWVIFNVDKTGLISNVKAENDPGYGVTAEAIRIISNGPKWIPAVQNGRNINFSHMQPVVFRIGEAANNPTEKKEYYFFCWSKAMPTDPAEKKYLLFTDIRKVLLNEVEVGRKTSEWKILVDGICANKNGCTSDLNTYPNYEAAKKALDQIKSRYKDTDKYSVKTVAFD